MSHPSESHEVQRQLELQRRITLTIADACELLSLGRTTFYKLIKDHKIPAIKCGRRTLIRRTDIENLLNSLPRSGSAS
jgi:excisionase family DNA binding protein